ncbi:3-oxoacyl-(acyl-carrier-protein) reductase [Sphingobium chlorophenolicum L-1]|uniref:3-oxoacyl-(Acyl-carrier-protein) reductase n=1 Tax=Sphingobium chlorophenolicum L-1 TaxID=690566 RepID=F6F3A6_SPHCR|nr:SDR family oxidoreductase [Sphingobium chlorophenolicum]AEG50918.1 3-oxoacyl-(acyl-carrier-protein) reductase [Sphingobium chlorophenolicum L-1]
MTDWYEGKSVVVTGGGSGIGAAAARRFAQEGAGVCVADINLEAAEAIATSIVAEGNRAIAVRADISDLDDNREMMRRAVDAFGALKAVFLNAAYLPPFGNFEDSSVEAFDKALAVNLRGTFLGLKTALSILQPGGAVVVTGSTAGIRGLPMGAAYSASKHGVLGLVASSSQSFAARGCRVNAICPGTTVTAMALEAGMKQDGDWQTVVDPAALPMAEFRGRLRPQHIAEVALFLASPLAGGINGTAYPVDAGYLSTMVE